ncbi:MAG: hypothetical protein ABEJ26_01310 [Halosimplex sp.]
MTGSKHTGDERFWTALNVGGLLVVGAVVSVALHAFADTWPAGFGGLVAAAFGLVGLSLLGYSLAVRASRGSSTGGR